MTEFSALYRKRFQVFEKFLSSFVLKELKKTSHPRLFEAMKYSLAAGGKRFRPVLSISAFLPGARRQANTDIQLVAASLELIHTYSLIHDDLPSMDNDDFRRGMPSCHKRFSESTAILAGDAMNSMAFYLLSDISQKQAIGDLLQLLHTGAGAPGMVSGQIEDLENENNKSADIKILNRIHNRKTGALIQAAMLMGNRLRKDYKKREKSVAVYSRKLGLLFQITDDILDVKGTMEDLGKTPGKDSDNGKLTFPAIYGMDKSEAMVKKLVKELVNLSRQLEPQNEFFFRDLPEYIANRKN